MRLLGSDLPMEDMTPERWEAVAERLRANKGGLGDLGGGNHFLDALLPYDDGPVHFLIHTGSRAESGHVDGLVDQPERFDREFAGVVAWAAENRGAVQRAIEGVFGRSELLYDLPHNTYEPLEGGGAIIRKGSVHVREGDRVVIPSHMAGDVVLGRATARVSESLESLSHGTGRKMSRSDCKPLAEGYDFDALRRAVLIPAGVMDASLRTDGPYAYRDLDECLALLEGYVVEERRLAVVGYMGHL